MKKDALEVIKDSIRNKQNELDLSRSQLTSLPPEIGELTNLIKLDLSGNQLTYLPLEIGELTNLIKLNLSGNQLTSLPPEIGKLSKLTELYLDGNPLVSPPLEIVEKGKDVIIKYLNSLENKSQILNELKVLLVGDGGAGKTSLVKKLLGEEFDEIEPQTHGIDIQQWHVIKEDSKIKINFWDFGGQEIMHATHQFFLTKRSLYILVLDGRKEEKTEYWLKHIESFGGNSPILVVINKIDENPSFDINRKFLQDKYKNINGFYRVSCKTGEGIESFKEYLIKSMTKVELLQTTWPISWLNIKSKLENMDDNFISYEKYKNLCIEENIVDKSAQNTLLDFLNDLGVVLHFKDFELFDTHILNPEWLTRSIYKILNSDELRNSKGFLRLNLVSDILKQVDNLDFVYPPDKYNYIIDLMKKFELCYEIDKETILIPDLLDFQEPNFEFDYKTSLKFIIMYDFLPKSVMPRFIVKRHKDIKNSLQWRTGVVIEDKDFHSIAVVKSDEAEKKIHIYVNGQQQRNYFSIIRKSFREINESFEKLISKELVPLPDNNEITIPYNELIGYELNRKRTYFVGELQKSYSVRKLLSGIEKREVKGTSITLKMITVLLFSIILANLFILQQNIEINYIIAFIALFVTAVGILLSLLKER